jgi:uncharacterized protein with PQ loop repeat
MVTYCDVSRVMTFLANVMISVGLYAQCYKIFRTKSSKDFNPFLVAALSIGQIMALNYGLAIREWPIIAISSFNLAPVTLLAIGCCRYRKRVAKATQAGAFPCDLVKSMNKKSDGLLEKMDEYLAEIEQGCPRFSSASFRAANLRSSS